MSSRKTPFVKGEYYHIYNRGVDKRIIFKNKKDLERFFQSMREFNTVNPIGSIYENSYKKSKNNQLGGSTSKLVDIVVFCLNPNHYHFLLTPLVDNGIEKFMHKLGTGYTMYFNEKNKRSGSLFQGKYKAKHIDSNEYLLQVSVYINLNNIIHKLGGSTSKLWKSSWDEYLGKSKENFCNKDIILGQFNNTKDFKIFSEELLDYFISKKEEASLKGLLLE